jgi:hypothetical protein
VATHSPRVCSQNNKNEGDVQEKIEKSYAEIKCCLVNIYHEKLNYYSHEGAQESKKADQHTIVFSQLCGS